MLSLIIRDRDFQPGTVMIICMARLTYILSIIISILLIIQAGGGGEVFEATLSR